MRVESSISLAKTPPSLLAFDLFLPIMSNFKLLRLRLTLSHCSAEVLEETNKGRREIFFFFLHSRILSPTLGMHCG